MPETKYRSPRPRLAITEAPRAVGDFAALLANAPLLSLAPRGDADPVLVMPGFGTSDASTVVLRQYLSSIGYTALPWELGRNLGPAMPELRARLVARLNAVFAESGGRKVTLIGWSMGGVYARLLAHLNPEKVRQVITLGSPIRGNPRSTRAYHVIRRLNGGVELEAHPTYSLRQLAGTPLPGIPSTAIFSKSDGVVPWPMAVEQPSELAENIEVFASHLGLGFSPTVLFAIADRLALPEGEWRPFHRHSWRAWVYGQAQLQSNGDQSIET